jgi:hypothetical protein
MAWLYASYLTEATPAGKIAMLQLHCIEVSQTLANPTAQTVDGLAYSKAQLTDYLTTLKTELKDLQRSNTGVMFLSRRLSDQ